MEVNGYAKAVVDEALRSVGGEAEFLCLTPNGRRKSLRLAAERIRYQYPDEYEAASLLSTAFQIYRGEDNLVDISKALAESADVRTGMDIQRAIGRWVREITHKKGARTPVLVTLNGNHAAAEVTLPEQDTAKIPSLFQIEIPGQEEPDEPEAKPEIKPAKPKRTNEPLLDAYRVLAEQASILPTDDAIAILTGCHIATPGKCRERLRTEGYEFERVDVPEKPSGKRRYHLWRVTVKGSEARAAKEAEARRAAEEQQRKLEQQRQQTLQALSEKVGALNFEQLQQLAALLK